MLRFFRYCEPERKAKLKGSQASQADQQLQRVSDDTREMQIEAIKQDLDFRNRLIEIFGTPYEGTIGPGQIYDEGYSGPDTLLYLYIDQITTAPLIPGGELAARAVIAESGTASTSPIPMTDGVTRWAVTLAMDGTVS